MLGKKKFIPKLFYQFSLEKLVPQDHFLRQVDKVLDLTFVRGLVRDSYGTTGNPSVDPVVLIKMMLIGYFYNIISERQLAAHIQMNLAYRWYLGYDIDESTPNHSVISKARTRFSAKVFSQIFQRVVQLCINAGLVQADNLLVDSTLVKANASLDSLVEIHHTPQQFIRQVYQNNPVPSKRTNERVKSTSDPEAAVFSPRNQKTQLAYKAHLGIDGGKERLITAAIATSADKADEKLLPQILKEQEKYRLSYHAVGADTKYGWADNYKYLKDKGIKPAIPRHSYPNPNKHFTLMEFQYSSSTNSYLCPANKTLTYQGYNRQERRHIYKAKAKDCAACVFKEKCCKAKARTLTVHRYQEQINWGKIFLLTPDARNILRKRKVVCEGINAEAKDNHGLRRAKCRGLVKMQIQLWLTATVMNLKRLVKANKKRASASITLVQRKEHTSQLIKLFDFLVLNFINRIQSNPVLVT